MSDVHARPGSGHARKRGQHMSPEARTTTMSFAPAVDLVAGNGVAL